jgi:hypothetical protein
VGPLFILPPFCTAAFDFTFKTQKRENEEEKKGVEKGGNELDLYYYIC